LTSLLKHIIIMKIDKNLFIKYNFSKYNESEKQQQKKKKKQNKILYFI